MNNDRGCCCGKMKECECENGRDMGRKGMLGMQFENQHRKVDLKENLENYKEELEEEIKLINKRISELSEEGSSEDKEKSD